MQKSSNSDYDGQSWNTAPLLIGRKGLDLRQSIDNESLTVLNNARFTDNISIERRTGHTYKLLQDSGNFNSISANATDTWLYGWGVVQSQQNVHYPIHNQSLATFNFDNSDVSWTGDRLLIHNTLSGKCLGASEYWANNKGGPITPSNSIKEGIPCYLPVLDDKLPPVKVINSSAVGSFDSASSDELVVLLSCAGTLLFTGVSVQVVNKITNSLINLTNLTTVSDTVINPRILYSSNKFVAYWINSTTSELYSSTFNGNTWSPALAILSAVTYDIYQDGPNGGYYLIYRIGANINARYYYGDEAQSSPFLSDTVVDVGGTTPNGPVAICSDLRGRIAAVFFTTTGYFAREYTANLTPVGTQVQINSSTNSPDACTITARSNSSNNAQDQTCWVAYCGYSGGSSEGVTIRSFARTASPTTQMDSIGTHKFKCYLQSRAFRVGDEVFVWMKSGNFSVNFLLSGVYKPIVCGYADFGEASVVNVLLIGAIGRTLPDVSRNESNQYKFTWARKVVTPDIGSNSFRYSEIDFLPQITTARYGSSVYLSGSAIQNFDGFECTNAGFQDLPIVSSGVASAVGGLSTGNYQIRVYAVRYNHKGERFISPALTSPVVAATAGQRITWQIQSLQSVTADDVFFEIYRTAANGTTFNLEGTVLNNKNVATISFITTLSDATIAANPGDPFQAQLGGLAQLLEKGPTGCRVIMTYNDRLWGSGGQVPAGKVQFSKLKRDEFGLAFSTLINTAIVDSEAGEIVSIGGMNDAVIVFQKEKISVIQGEGPDNFGRGNFPAARFAAAKGATTHYGTVLTDAGLVYWNEGGPHLFTGQFTVENISDAVRPLAITLVPTGVRINPQKQEVIWYTSGGTALLWDYKSGSRWATWSNLFVNGVSSTALAFRNGLLMLPDDTVYTDGGQEYIFSGRTAQLTADKLLQGYSILRRYGMVGNYLGEHTVTFRVYYNGSPLWEENETWEPETDTYLQPASAFADLTAAQVDALASVDKSGNYATHRRARRQNCQRFQLEFLDNGPNGPSFSPQYLEFELGARPGFGRGPKTTFTGSTGSVGT